MTCLEQCRLSNSIDKFSRVGKKEKQTETKENFEAESKCKLSPVFMPEKLIEDARESIASKCFKMTPNQIDHLRSTGKNIL